jgi:hypothetical protein
MLSKKFQGRRDNGTASSSRVGGHIVETAQLNQRILGSPPFNACSRRSSPDQRSQRAELDHVSVRSSPKRRIRLPEREQYPTAPTLLQERRTLQSAHHVEGKRLWDVDPLDVCQRREGERAMYRREVAKEGGSR